MVGITYSLVLTTVFFLSMRSAIVNCFAAFTKSPAVNQGLTLVQFSAQCKHFSWNRGW
jgi:hypothetical protein